MAVGYAAEKRIDSFVRSGRRQRHPANKAQEAATPFRVHPFAPAAWLIPWAFQQNSRQEKAGSWSFGCIGGFTVHMV